jgi:hypothetical protein
VAEDPQPLARIRLERSIPRLVSGPLIVGLAGAGAIIFGLLAGGTLGLALAALGVAVVGIAIAAAFVLLSIRLEVEEAQIRLRWPGGHRVYPLARGAVTRVTVRGPEASSLRPRVGGLGWGIGPAQLRDDETIDVVRLAPTRTVILVPTELRRLAIAPHSEAELLEALSDAAQVRQRLEALARIGPPADTVEPPADVEADVEAESADDELEPEPAHALTGIERALLEERLAAERDALAVPPPAVETAPIDVAIERPAEAGAESAVEPAPPVARARRRLPLPPMSPALGTTMAFLVLPLLAAGALWGIAGALDRLPAAGTDRMNLVALTLVLGGPATAVGAVMARIWWPRLIGVVVSSGLAALVIAARALLGG